MRRYAVSLGTVLSLHFLSTMVAAAVSAATVPPEDRVAILDFPIRVSGPVTITRPGHYLLTGDIHVDQSPLPVTAGVDIRTGGVDLDLNGYVIYAGSLIGVSISGHGSGRVAIKNGRIEGPGPGIVSSGGVDQLSVEKLGISTVDEGISVRAVAGVEILSCIVNTDVQSISVVGYREITIADSFISSSILNSVHLEGLRGTISSNTIYHDGQGLAIEVVPTVASELSAHTISDNLVSGLSSGERGLVIRAPNNLVTGNVIEVGTGDGVGIMVSSDRNRIFRNVVRVFHGAPGVVGVQVVSGEGNQIQNNQFIDITGCGIEFVGGIGSNTFRKNTLTGEGQPICVGTPAQK